MSLLIGILMLMGIAARHSILGFAPAVEKRSAT